MDGSGRSYWVAQGRLFRLEGGVLAAERGAGLEGSSAALLRNTAGAASGGGDRGGAGGSQGGGKRVRKGQGTKGKSGNAKGAAAVFAPSGPTPSEVAFTGGFCHPCVRHFADAEAVRIAAGELGGTRGNVPADVYIREALKQAGAITDEALALAEEEIAAEEAESAAAEAAAAAATAAAAAAEMEAKAAEAKAAAKAAKVEPDGGMKGGVVELRRSVRSTRQQPQSGGANDLAVSQQVRGKGIGAAAADAHDADADEAAALSRSGRLRGLAAATAAARVAMAAAVAAATAAEAEAKADEEEEGGSGAALAVARNGPGARDASWLREDAWDEALEYNNRYAAAGLWQLAKAGPAPRESADK